MIICKVCTRTQQFVVIVTANQLSISPRNELCDMYSILHDLDNPIYLSKEHNISQRFTNKLT